MPNIFCTRIPCANLLSKLTIKKEGKYCSSACYHADVIQDPSQRFWIKVQKSNNECWLWKGAKTSSGYGNFMFKMNEFKPAHRVAYELTYGPISDELFVCHHCDVRLCCRPDHLFLGTNGDNMQDAYNKGRMQNSINIARKHFTGTKNPKAKLIEQQVREIRQLKGIQNAKKVAEVYHVTAKTIYSIWSNGTWKNI